LIETWNEEGLGLLEEAGFMRMRKLGMKFRECWKFWIFNAEIKYYCHWKRLFGG
jgi:hypothetical protein